MFDMFDTMHASFFLEFGSKGLSSFGSENLANSLEALVHWAYLVEDSALGEELELELKNVFFNWFHQKFRIWGVQRGLSKTSAITKLINIWLAYIQPWNVLENCKKCFSSWTIQYFKDAKAAVFHKESVVFCDYPFLNVILLILLTGFVEHANLYYEDLEDLQNILEVFSDEDFKRTLFEVEANFLSGGRPSDCNLILFFLHLSKIELAFRQNYLNLTNEIEIPENMMFTTKDSLLLHEAMLLVRTLPKRIEKEDIAYREAALGYHKGKLDGLFGKLFQWTQFLLMRFLRDTPILSAFTSIKGVFSSVSFSLMNYRFVRTSTEALNLLKMSGSTNKELADSCVEMLEQLFGFQRSDPKISEIRSQREMLEVRFTITIALLIFL
jgi:hypothetical protein